MVLSEGGWSLNATRGDTRSKMIIRLMRLTVFHTEYWTPSGPGAEEEDDFERACVISSLVRGAAEGFCLSRPLHSSRVSLGRKI